MIGPRRLAIIAAALCGTVTLVGCGIAAIAGFGLSDIKNIHASPIGNQATADIDKASSQAVSAVAAAASAGASQMPASETPPVQIAMANVPDLPNADAEEAVTSAETPEESQTIAPETRPAQIATASVDDVVHGDFKGVVSAESPPDSSHALAIEAPPDGKEEATSTGTHDECLERDVCVDQYLWSAYQRAPKEDTIKGVERRKVTVNINGKPQTVIKEFTTLVDEDFAWKDPKAAEKAGMSLMEYVIGGMDRDFKLKLYRAVHAMDDAGLSPGITSAFRDDYRQSLASGLKAATNRSFHGGSLRGGYGHGLAADIVSVNGETRAQRFISSESLWKWIDAHGKHFGIGRPYLDKDPAHVAPIDGKEYADHRRVENTRHARSEIIKRNLLAVRDASGLGRTARSSQ